MDSETRKNNVDRWIINVPNTLAKAKDNTAKPSEKIKIEDKNNDLKENFLTDELSGWVGEIPGVIGKKDIEYEVPEVIKNPSSSSTVQSVSEESPETFWAVDEDTTAPKNEQGPALNKEHTAKKIKELLGRELEVLVEQYCQKTVEKVAWEIIPDLAENLIKEEIQKITQSTEASHTEDVHNRKSSRPHLSEDVLRP